MMQVPAMDIAMVRFPVGTEVYKAKYMAMEGFVLSTFWMLHEGNWELTCIFQQVNGKFGIAKQNDLRPHKRMIALVPSRA